MRHTYKPPGQQSPPFASLFLKDLLTSAALRPYPLEGGTDPRIGPALVLVVCPTGYQEML